MAGAPDGLVVISEEQTGGRGRLGRTFQSPKGRGLYVSALLRPQLPPAEVTDFTAWVAVAVCDGIEAACGLRPQIKWTNDIILNGKKVCGILTEMGLESESNALQYLIPGIGINANHAPEDFSEDVRPMATSLAQELGHPVRRSELAVQVIRALDRMYAAFPLNGFDHNSNGIFGNFRSKIFQIIEFCINKSGDHRPETLLDGCIRLSGCCHGTKSPAMESMFCRDDLILFRPKMISSVFPCHLDHAFIGFCA